jgi:hypothetical protein
MLFSRHILMIRPASFGFNPQTAVNNRFQQPDPELSVSVNETARQEFDNLVAVLNAAGIDVLVTNDTSSPLKPDALFPNNWFCMMPGGDIHLFPLFAPNRRTERRSDIIDELLAKAPEKKLVDWTDYESRQEYLESTGSMVFDHTHKIAYACISDRTHARLLDAFCKETDYAPFSFLATDKNGVPIYHTNVLMCIGNGFALLCTDAIPDVQQRKALTAQLEATGLLVIIISLAQMEDFAGNMLQVINKEGHPVLVMSEAAFNSLDKEQKQQIEKHTRIVSAPIPTIESLGGGSVRCMLAELFF